MNDKMKGMHDVFFILSLFIMFICFFSGNDITFSSFEMFLSQFVIFSYSIYGANNENT